MNIIKAYSWNHENEYFRQIFDVNLIQRIDKSVYKINNIVFCPFLHIPKVLEKINDNIILITGGGDLYISKINNQHHIMANNRS